MSRGEAGTAPALHLVLAQIQVPHDTIVGKDPLAIRLPRASQRPAGQVGVDVGAGPRTPRVPLVTGDAHTRGGVDESGIGGQSIGLEPLSIGRDLDAGATATIVHHGSRRCPTR